MSGLSCGMRDLSSRPVGSSLVVVRGLSCPVACGILVPRTRIKPVSLALEGGFLTTGPPGKSQSPYFKVSCFITLISSALNSLSPNNIVTGSGIRMWTSLRAIILLITGFFHVFFFFYIHRSILLWRNIYFLICDF